ncbi:MAG: 3-oxo-tetronate kinase [Rubripirellula sp.]
MSLSETTSNRRPVLGCIADDVTGATDLAINLVHGGMKVVQVLGVPSAEQLSGLDADAVVVALKSRSIPCDEAIALSLESLETLRDAGAQRFFFKYCSTFDSTARGNIGPVAEALMKALKVEQTIFCPAFPRNGRSVYQGHLFVGDRLLNESGMEDHPLNPMRDANLVRVLQTQSAQSVGQLVYGDYAGDVSEILSKLAQEDAALVVTDACDDGHLQQLAEAVSDMELVTGGSGIGRYLPEAYRRSRLLNTTPFEPVLPRVEGRSLIVAGSCSRATQQQVEWMRTQCPSQPIDVAQLMIDSSAIQTKLVAWAAAESPQKPVMFYSTAAPDEVAKLQKQYGTDELAAAIEGLLASVVRTLVEQHAFRKLVLAGGETSGAIVKHLGVEALEIGPEICAGVPWTISSGSDPLCLALKSGNFGETDFFAAALEMLR